jgi:hypothetical protein
MSIAKSINMNDEMSGGYDIDDLLHDNNGQMMGGGANIFADMQIPLGLYYVDEVASNFYKAANSTTIEDDMFDKLFDLVTKNKSKGGATRREKVVKHKVTKRKRTYGFR